MALWCEDVYPWYYIVVYLNMGGKFYYTTTKDLWKYPHSSNDSRLSSKGHEYIARITGDMHS